MFYITEEEQKANEGSLSLSKNLTNIQQIVIFLTGIFGLSLFATIYELIARSLIDEAIIDIAFRGTIYGVWMNFFAYLPIAVIMVFLLGKVAINTILKQFKDKKSISEGFTFAAILIFGSAFINSLFMSIGTLAGLEYSVNDNESLIRESIANLPLISFFFVVVFAPFVEELTYRVGLFGSLKKKNRVLAYVVCAIFFGFIHFNFQVESKNDLLIELLNLPSYIFAGLLFCFAYDRNESFVACWIPHVFNNLLSFLFTISATLE